MKKHPILRRKEEKELEKLAGTKADEYELEEEEEEEVKPRPKRRRRR